MFSLTDAENNSIADRISFVLGHNLQIKFSKGKKSDNYEHFVSKNIKFYQPVRSEDNPFHFDSSSYGYGPKESSKDNTFANSTHCNLGKLTNSSLSLSHFFTRRSPFLKLWKKPHRGAVFPYLSAALQKH